MNQNESCKGGLANHRLVPGVWCLVFACLFEYNLSYRIYMYLFKWFYSELKIKELRSRRELNTIKELNSIKGLISIKEPNSMMKASSARHNCGLHGYDFLRYDFLRYGFLRYGFLA